MVDAEPTYTVSTVHFSKGELTNILNQLRSYRKPNDFTLKGERPHKEKRPAEFETHYRKKMSKYIKLNTGIEIEPNSTVVGRFYDDVADFLGL